MTSHPLFAGIVLMDDDFDDCAGGVSGRAAGAERDRQLGDECHFLQDLGLEWFGCQREFDFLEK